MFKRPKYQVECFLVIVFGFILSVPIVAYILWTKEGDLSDATTYGIAHIRQISGDWS